MYFNVCDLNFSSELGRVLDSLLKVSLRAFEVSKSPLCFELGCFILDRLLVLSLVMTCFYIHHTSGLLSEK